MRMRLCRVSAAAIWLAFSVVPSADAQEKKTPEPAPKVMRYIQRSIAWYPNSVFSLIENTRYPTPSGSYRLVEVNRTCASQALTVNPTLLIDEMAETVWEGGISQLPPLGETGAGPEAMRKSKE